jgi:pimeloyl-ACP methyl ester carboxylesterase
MRALLEKFTATPNFPREPHLWGMRITVNHTGLYVDVEGPELAVAGDELQQRPTIVVLHGGRGSTRATCGPAWAAGRRRAGVFVDLRGQGRSDPAPVEACTLEQMADDVAALVATLGVRAAGGASGTPRAGSWRSSSRCAIPGSRAG